MKIKALNAQTGEFHEKVLIPEPGIAGECFIGRNPSCSLVLNSPDVSRIHGRIFYQNGQFYYTDLGSTDGSQIDELDVEINQNYILKPDHLIRIGGYVLTIAQIPLTANNPNHEPHSDPVKVATPPQTTKWTLRCVEAIDETHDVKTFRFVADPPRPFTYQPGQFVTLDLQINQQRVKRSYSISSSPSRPYTLDITVKRVPPPTDVPEAPPGLVSNWLHDHIKVGNQVNVSGPMGKFTYLAQPSNKLLLISAGSGITPMMSMSRWICDTAADIDVVFIHSARSPRDIIFRQELEAMAAQHSHFKLAVTATRLEPGQAWLGYTGRLNPSRLEAIAPDFRDRTVYVCGPNSFMAGIKAMLKDLEFPMQNYYEESFGSNQKSRQPSRPETKLQPASEITKAVRHEQSKAPNDPPTPVSGLPSSESVIIFTQSGKKVAGDGDEFILDLAEQEGIELPSGCRMGSCGVCKQKLLEGRVNYDEDPGCEEGYVLTCIAKPVGRVAIEA
ncbi:MAG TPA: flavodoxin [Cyanobacteria bacterium UBA8803]|nr:flavodoxin [Cyanobacteria bacterium UBA9273]HBL62952.1 flavodoxin [Cyanobacteria bacterium UBA8803]